MDQDSVYRLLQDLEAIIRKTDESSTPHPGCGACVKVRERLRVEMNRIYPCGGEWLVRLRAHGEDRYLEHGLEGALVMYIGLPALAGWTPIAHEVRMPHQITIQPILRWLEGHPGAREVALLDLEHGKWVSVWRRLGERVEGAPNALRGKEGSWRAE